MRISLLLSVLLLSLQVSAYDLYGGYERILFFYLYVADCEVHNGIASAIAVNCAVTFGLDLGPTSRRKRCNFNEFVSYINNVVRTSQDRRNVLNIATDDELLGDHSKDNVHTVANRLKTAGQTDHYEPGRIVDFTTRSRPGTTEVFRVFETVSELVKDKRWLNDASNKVRDMARIAAKYARDGRIALNFQAITDAVDRNHPGAVIPGRKEGSRPTWKWAPGQDAVYKYSITDMINRNAAKGIDVKATVNTVADAARHFMAKAYIYRPVSRPVAQTYDNFDISGLTQHHKDISAIRRPRLAVTEMPTREFLASKIPLDAWQRRLKSNHYFDADVRLALQGESIPLCLGHPTVRACVVRGIRAHDGFGHELRGRDPLFTRALNARMIMSDHIPQDMTSEDTPYCIWYPSTASETTYRKLAQQYPTLKYQVGRACAVAGYPTLYEELDLLPEVHIAEEARDNGHDHMFSAIASRTMFSIMDDYHRAINLDNPKQAEICSDTAVRSQVDDLRRAPAADREITQCQSLEYRFNITEDYSYDAVSEDTYSNGAFRRADLLAMKYLYTPLPRCLPTLDRDLLILIAAYNGDIDRYTRLRRSMLLPREKYCLLRGIYHSTFFAKYWALNLEADDTVGLSKQLVMAAVYAREIMDNNITNIAKESRRETLPYCIWYPKVPSRTVLRELAYVQPSMKAEIARACIVADEQDLYDELDPPYDGGILAEAEKSSNEHYRDDMARKKHDLGSTGNERESVPGWKLITVKDLIEQEQRPGTWLRDIISDDAIDDSWADVYAGRHADIKKVELRVSMTKCEEVTGLDRMPTTLPPAADAQLEKTGRNGIDIELDADLIFGKTTVRLGR